MIDAKKFANEVYDEVKEQFENLTDETGNISSQVFRAIAIVAAIAIAKYDRENPR